MAYGSKSAVRVSSWIIENTLKAHTEIKKRKTVLNANDIFEALGYLQHAFISDMASHKIMKN